MTQSSEYQQLTPRFRELVRRSLPASATVVVVSKGDEELLQVGTAKAWHFPRREDGVYAGYYPADSQAATAHLEHLRGRGAEYLVFPQTSFWWLEHYADFRRHLESNYPVVLHERDTCLIFALSAPLPQAGGEAGATAPVSAGTVLTKALSLGTLDERLKADLLALFDLEYYSAQAGQFASREAALADYLARGFAKGYSPNSLFDPAYYARQYPQAALSLPNPLVHFLVHAATEFQNPSPYFDTEYYYRQDRSLLSRGVNALVHYLTEHSPAHGCRPNPMFATDYYRNNCPAARRSKVNPLAHFLAVGCAEGHFASPTHQSVVQTLLGDSRQHLFRGQWRSGVVLLFAEGSDPAETQRILGVARTLASGYHLRSLVVLSRRNGQEPDPQDVGLVVLEDFQIACDVLRPSALHLLVRSLRSLQPLFALSALADLLEILQAEGIPAMLLAGPREVLNSQTALQRQFAQATRVVFHASEDFHSAARRLGHHPPRVALLPFTPQSLSQDVDHLLELAQRDFGIPARIREVELRRAASKTRKIIIPCSDWTVSGVNSALESVGKALIARGWDVEILFTRGAVGQMAGHSDHLPAIPFRHLKAPLPGLAGMWEALIADLESNAPCLMLTAYDFAANGVVSALSDKVGVITWAQSDDKDYYEQVYRLGRYCNAIVCVSQHIQASVTALNPALGLRTRVIHNSSVWEKDIADKKPARSKRMRLIYTGRLVQYQKRILDLLDLTAALDQLAVPYVLTLVGEFSPRETTEQTFRARAHAHLADGRIRLLGRLKRDQVLEELSVNEFFVLPSEFEGLPLSLVEAMTRGCVPVVADMDSGIRELVFNDESGLILRDRNYSNWANRLVECWRNPQGLAAISQRARQVIQIQFTLEHIGEQFNQLCEEVAQEICAGTYRRPDCLNWGKRRSPAGDVLPPPSLFTLPQERF
jgi:glycosyltransferase involved in cell wall biosynthesis